MKPKFSIYKYAYCCYLIKHHKRIFRTYYRQDWVISESDRKDIHKFDKRFNKYPDFRPYVKMYKPLINKAFNVYGGVKLKYLNKLASKLSTELYATYC